MERERLQLDFLIPGFANEESTPQFFNWEPSPTSSTGSSRPVRIVELNESNSSDSPPDHGSNAAEEELDSAVIEAIRKSSSASSKSGSSAGSTGGGVRKGRGKQAFRHRKSHIKSKNGCFSCKDRRVKVNFPLGCLL